MDRYAEVGESSDFDRFPSPFDSGIERKVQEIARKYGVALRGSPHRSVSPVNTQTLIQSIRKKYLTPNFPSVETPDWQVSDSEPGSPGHFDEEVQTEKAERDMETQTEGVGGGNDAEKQLFPSRKWDIKRISSEKAKYQGKKSPEKPPLSRFPASPNRPKATSRPISRSKIRNFEDFLQQNPISPPSSDLPATSLLDTDPNLVLLAARKRSLLSHLQRVEAAKADL